MFKDFFNMRQAKLQDGWKIIFALISIALTLFLVTDALERILFSIKKSAN